MQIQKIHSIYIYHLFRSKDSKDSLLYCSSILLYSDTELSLIKSKKKNYFFFCFLNSHIHYPEDSFISGLFKIKQWPCYEGLYSESWCFTHWIYFQNYHAEPKIKAALEVFIPLTLAEGRDNRDRKSPNVVYICPRFEVLKFVLKKTRGQVRKFTEGRGKGSTRNL